MSRTTAAAKASDRLLELLAPYRRVLVVMHDNPDPDAIASGWGLKTLVETRLGKPTRLVAGGAIVRAENQHMVELLQPPVELVNELSAEDLNHGNTAAVILVDCGVGADNHLLTRHHVKPLAVVDHHLVGSERARLPFKDIRTYMAASAGIVGVYLREQDVEPGVKLATALVYAFRTDACGYECQYSPEDREILLWLTERADPGLLAEIENAPLSRDYFGDLVLAMQNTFLYGDVAYCLLPRASGAEIVGEVADLLIRCRGVHRVLCGAVLGEDLVLSARTERDDDNAAELLRETIRGLGGGAGGHLHRAGGKVPDVGSTVKAAEELQSELRGRWLAACGIERQRGVRLVALREIVQNL